MLGDIERISKTELLMAIDRMESAPSVEELEEAFTVATDAIDALYNSMKVLIELLGEDYEQGTY